MKIEFELTIDDLLNFNLYHFAHSSSTQKTINSWRIIFPVFALIISLLVMILLEIQIVIVPLIIISSIGAIILYFIIPTIYRNTTMNNVRKMLKEGDNKSILGRKILELSEKGLHITGNAGEGSYNWQSIIRLEENEKYLFLYQSSYTAIVIPKKAFTSIEELQKINSYIREKVNQI